MIKNPAQQSVGGKSRRWLSSLSLLAVPLITLILPAISPSSYAAKAQEPPPVGAPCRPPLQASWCYYTQDAIRFYGYIDGLVYRWMNERGLPPSDLEGVIHKFGREDLVADINAYIAAQVLTLLEKPAEKRTPDEQIVVGWFERDISRTELALYEYMVKDAESFIRDPCGWKPDPEVAEAYGLEYDGTPYCSNRGIGTLFRFHIPGPKAEYLYAAAFKATYGHLGHPLTAMLMQENIGKHLAATAAATIPGGVAGGVIGKNISKFMSYTFQERYKGMSEAARKAFKVRFTRFLGGGAFGIVTFMANIGIEAIIAFAEEIKFQEDLQRFRATRDRLAAAGVNTTDTIMADKGMDKAVLITNSYGLWPGREPLPKYRPGVDRVFIVREGTVTRPMDFLPIKDHADQSWTVSMWGNWFLRSMRSDDGTTIESITPELEVTDHGGIQWLATRVGPNRFRMTQVNPREGAVVCPVFNGVSSRRDASCSVYDSDSINIKLPDGQNVNINLGVAPRIESSDSYFFPARTQTSQPIQVTGSPTPILQVEAKPGWLRLVNGNLIGDPGTLTGTSHVELTARTQSGLARKHITIYHGEPVQFMSSDIVHAMVAEPFEFTIKTAGTPRPRITTKNWFPSNITFQDNGNGTATLRGSGSSPGVVLCVPVRNSAGTFSGCPPTIVASNGVQTVEQQLTFRFHPQPSATFEGPSELKFVAGVESRYLLTTSGARTPVEWQTPFGQRLADELRRVLPWINFREQPDGTALVSGVPPMNGQSSTTAFVACPVARSSQFMNCSPLIPNLTVTVDGATRFMSDAVGTATVGRAIDIQLVVNRLDGWIGFNPYQILSIQAPKGLRIENAPPQRNGSVTSRILGVPEPGQGGRYEFPVTWTNYLSSVSSLFSLDVLEPARINSPDSFTFIEGTSASGQVTTQGYPVNAAGVDCGPGKDCADMSIRLEWGPRRIEGLTLTDRNPQGIATGVGVFGGVIPQGASGVYEANIFASNGRMAPEARKPIRIVVLPAGDLNGDGKSDCSDLTTILNAMGSFQPVPGQGVDLTGDMVVDQRDVDALVRAVKGLWACLI